MKLKLPVFLAAGVVAMGLLLVASTTQAQTEHLPAVIGLVLDADAQAQFPVTEPAGGGGGGGSSSGTCFIDTAGGGFFPSIFHMFGDDYGGRVSERSAQRGKHPVD